MEYGELAVNYNDTEPTIFLKTSTNDIVAIAGGPAAGAVDLEAVTAAGNFSDNSIIIGSSKNNPSIILDSAGTITTTKFLRSQRTSSTDVNIEGQLNDTITSKLIANGSLALGGTIDSTTNQATANIFLNGDTGNGRFITLNISGTASFGGLTTHEAGVNVTSGDLGLGTSSPKSKLDVRGTILTETINYGNDQDQAYLIAGTKNYTGADTNWGTHGFQHRFKTNSVGTARVTIDTDQGEAFCVDTGNKVGIGTSSPSTTLDVNGDVTFGLKNASSLGTDANGKIIAGSLVAATTDVAGIVQLSTSINNTSTIKAATPSAVKSAYDRAASYAPSKTGSGASGTWGISITGGAGSAGTATTATTATNCSRSVDSSNGLTGGGDLTSNRTISGINASTSQKGVVKLSSSTSSSSADLAATASAVKSAYDRAASYAPSKSGSGASGTWGINISGNAAKVAGGTNGNTRPILIRNDSNSNSTGNFVVGVANGNNYPTIVGSTGQINANGGIKTESIGADGNSTNIQINEVVTVGGTNSATAFRVSGDGQTNLGDSVYKNTASNAANMNIASNGSLRRESSSLRYKRNVETVEDSYADNFIDNARPIYYEADPTSENVTIDPGTEGYTYWGFIAEEMAVIDPRLVAYDREDRPDGVQYSRITVLLTNVIKRQKKQIADLTARIEALEAS